MIPSNPYLLRLAELLVVCILAKVALESKNRSLGITIPLFGNILEVP